MAAAACGLVAVLAGCSTGAPDEPSANPRSTTPATKPAVLRVPKPEPDLKTLVVAKPHRGNGVIGTFKATKAPLWLAIDCQGPGDLKLLMPGIGSFEIPCTQGRVNSTLNQIDVKKSRTLTPRIQAPHAVQWSVRVQQ
ncbi:hypothetical protein SMC26_18615 [Actinomadura fulvescens]|uniref:hypothetical protein n=1 Tax=Actinomadura fulvescens TaxID=46160 RepID=UPI0031DCF64A